MNEDPEKESTPSDAPTPPKDQVSKNEAISQSVYPDPDKPKPIDEPLTTAIARDQAKGFSLASAAMDEALTLIAGVASSTSYILISYLSKNMWVTAIVSAALAGFAIYFALRNYGRDGKMGPLTVIGLAAATVAIVSVANILIAQLMIRSTFGNYY